METVADQDLESLIGRIPACCSSTPDLRCCCGRTDCAYLKHNCVALADLEKEVRTAAQLGQALLARHEQYMYDAEKDRLEMSAKIEQLEADKQDLEDQNSKTAEENRSLLDQLEELNTNASESESHIKSLEATLVSTRQELRRLETLASRTHDLEIQLAALEVESEILRRTVSASQDDERSAVGRWRQAERKLNDLHEQLERIEREAREERERHVEVLGRMERQRNVERELDTAAGRLKGAAASRTGVARNGSNVVSHFVKDILQDNANLQIGIVELREMLMDSNDEIQRLREQLQLHQPMVEDNSEDKEDHVPTTLGAELTPKEQPPVISQALHIHHHYHAPKKEETRRPKKKRSSLNTSLFTPPRVPHHPRTMSRGQETENAILSQTAVTIPQPATPKRWSVQSGQMSDFAPSSVPSSPQSAYRHSGLFDRAFDMDSSRPTSPGSSIDPMSPQLPPRFGQFHRKKGSEVSTRSFAPITFQQHVIHEEEDDDVEALPDFETPSMPFLDDATSPSDVSRDTDYLPNNTEDWTADFQPSLRRSTSHESILSISGIDIHTLKSRPSQVTIRGSSLRPRSRIGSPTAVVSMDTIVSARPTISRVQNSTAFLRSVRGQIADTRSISSSGSNEGIGSKLGGWFTNHWGTTPTKSTGTLRPTPTISIPQQRSVSSPPIDSIKSFSARSPGINQKGPIPGFVVRTEKAPHKVKPSTVDHDALREILMEGGMP